MNKNYDIKLFSCLIFPIYLPTNKITNLSLQINFLDIDTEEKAVQKFGSYEIFPEAVKTRYKYVLYGDTIKRVSSTKSIYECELKLDRKIITSDNESISPTGELHGYYSEKDIFIIDRKGNKKKLSPYKSEIQQFINNKNKPTSD